MRSRTSKRRSGSKPKSPRRAAVLNAVAARLAALLARVLETEVWQVPASIRPSSGWPGSAMSRPSGPGALVRTARRLTVLPETREAFQSGDHPPRPGRDRLRSGRLARSTTVAQLRRVLSKHSLEPARSSPEPEEEPRRVSFGFDENGVWRLSAVLPRDEGPWSSGRCPRHATNCFEGASTSITWAIEKTAAPPTRPTFSACASTIIGCTIGEGWASPATPTSQTAWCSPTSVAGGWPPASRRPSAASRELGPPHRRAPRPVLRVLQRTATSGPGVSMTPRLMRRRPHPG
jgi:hypothetical protein